MFEIEHLFSRLAAFDDITSQYKLELEDITLLYNPSFDGKGTIHPNLLYSITANGKCIEGAWDFMNFIMSEEFQVSKGYYHLTSGRFSTLKSAFEKNLEHDQWISYNPEIPMDDGTISHNFEFMSGPMTDKDLDKILQCISECTKIQGGDEAVQSIVGDEFARYIEGE